MNLTTALESVFDSDDERAVSPVIGVILMVAITVILTAVIATFVLDLGGSTDQNPQAGVSFNQQSSGDVLVQLNAVQRADSFTVSASGASPTFSPSANGLSAVGDTVTVGGVSSGDTITVTATYQGNTAVVGTYTVN